MAQQTFTRGMWVPPPLPGMAGNSGPPSTRGETLSTIDAINESYGAVIAAPKTGNIRSVYFHMGNVTTGATITIGAYNLTLADGAPDLTSPVSTNSFITKAIATTDAGDLLNSGNFTADAAVTKGQHFAICWTNPGASAGNMRFNLFRFPAFNFPYVALYTGTWAKNVGQPSLVLVYDDGSLECPLGCFPGGTTTTGAEDSLGTQSPSTATNPEQCGARFKFEGPVRVNGAWLYADADGDHTIQLVTADWDGASSGLLATATIDKDIRQGTAAGLRFVEFDTSVDLDADTYYRLVISPTSATALSFYYMTFQSASFQALMPMGNDFHFTTAKDPNDDTDWTNYDENHGSLWRTPIMGLIVDGIDDGASVGGTTIAGTTMRRGMV